MTQILNVTNDINMMRIKTTWIYGIEIPRWKFKEIQEGIVFSDTTRSLKVHQISNSSDEDRRIIVVGIKARIQTVYKTKSTSSNPPFVPPVMTGENAVLKEFVYDNPRLSNTPLNPGWFSVTETCK